MTDPTDDSITDPLSDEQRVRLWSKIMRHTPTEGLEYMAKMGYKIKIDRYYQLMTEINKLLPKRLAYEAKQGSIDQHFANIDIIENLIMQSARDHQSLDPGNHAMTRLKIQESILKMIQFLSAYRESTQMIFEKQLEAKNKLGNSSFELSSKS